MKTRCTLFLLSIFSCLVDAQELIVPVGHLINDIDFSDDEKLIVTSSNDGTLKIWDASSQKLLRTVKAEGGDFTRFSPDGTVFYGYDDQINSGTLRAWETATGTLKYEKTFYGDDQRFNNSRTILALGHSSKPNALQLIDLTSGQLLRQLDNPSKYNTGSTSKIGQFSPDDKFLLGWNWNDPFLWDVGTGKIATIFEEYNMDKKPINTASLSPDGKLVFAAYRDNIIKIWQTNSRKLIFKENLISEYSSKAMISPDNQLLMVATDSTANVFDIASGKLKFEIRGSKFINDIKFSRDSKSIFISRRFSGIAIVDAATGKISHFIKKEEIIGLTKDGSALITPSGKYFGLSSGEPIKSKSLEGLTVSTDVHFNKDFTMVQIGSNGIYDALSGSLMDSVLNGSLGGILVDGKIIKSKGDTTRITMLKSQKAEQKFFGTHPITSGDGSLICTFINDKTKVWNAASGQLILEVSILYSQYNRVQISMDNNLLVINDRQDRNRFRVWDLATQKKLLDIFTVEAITDIQFSPDSKLLAVLDKSSIVNVWNISKNVIETKLYESSSDGKAHFWGFQTGGCRFSPDGKTLMAHNAWSVYIWKLSDTSTETIKFDTEFKITPNRVEFTPTGQFLIVSDYYNRTVFWDIAGRIITKSFKGVFKAFNEEKSLLVTQVSRTLFFWDFKSSKELFSVVSLPNSQMVVYNSAGIFDATPSAMDKLYFVQGLETIDLDQLKIRYYEPGLWRKVVSRETVRETTTLTSLELPPSIKVSDVNEKGYIQIELTNKGSGIGEVNVLINGKEIIQDARGVKSDINAPLISLKVYIANSKNLIKGSENFIAIKAWNAGHWVVSKSNVVSYKLAGDVTYKPSVHILTCGVSDYTGSEIDLKFAAKDAEDVKKALQLGAKKLFSAERSYTYNLTTLNARETYPTKANILKAFNQISSTSNPNDVVVVYLSGHGINVGGQDGDWHFLTQEANSASASSYNDKNILRSNTLSSAELVELFKSIPAAKQVLMIDACASGKVVENLMAKKGIESSSLRALDRMKDRTGLHIITGCTADAVSYEASQYGQGVLTYSLLEGIRGAALRDEQFVDVNRLFQYAQERVPVLASGIGGIQTPMVFSPNGSQSFDVGQLGELEKKEIPIAKVKSVYTRANFQDENDLEDVLGLGKKVNESLNETSAKGAVVFVDVSEYPGGCKLIGRYKKENGKIILKLKKRCDGKESTVELIGIDINDLSNQILRSLK